MHLRHFKHAHYAGPVSSLLLAPATANQYFLCMGTTMEIHTLLEAFQGTI